MTATEQYQELSDRFSNLANKAELIMSRYGSIYNCSPEKVREYILIGQEQENVQKEMDKLFEVNGGIISN